MDKVKIILDWDDPSPAALKGYFAELFAALDAEPRPVFLRVKTTNDRAARASIDLADGEPIFRIDGRRDVRADFRGRWLAEHPVPLKLKKHGYTKLVLTPTSGNRVKVRRATFWGRLFR